MTTEEIRQELTSAFMNNANAATLFGFTQGANFDNTFSRAGLLSILFYVVAYVIALKENALDAWKSDIATTADSTRYGTWQWWIDTCKAYQDGDSTTVINGKVTYATIDTTKQIIAIATAKPNTVNNGTGLNLYVAKTSADSYASLTTTAGGELDRFKIYINQVKPLGLPVNVYSGAPTTINITMEVTYNTTISTTNLTTLIKNAISDYLISIPFGGTIYRSRIISAICSVDGVLACSISAWTADGSTIATESYSPTYGYAILSNTFAPTLTYTNSNANNQ